MRLKYYLRGLGAGILFSVLIFVFVVGPKESAISDEEIIQRAKQLGMVEENELSIDMEKLRENTSVPSPTNILSPTGSTSPSPTTGSLSPTSVLTPTSSLSSELITTTAPTSAPPPTNDPLPSSTPTPTPTVTPPADLTDLPSDAKVDESDTVSAVVVIKSGMRSEEICEVIRKAGIIKDSMEFNAFLIQNGYAEKLRSGNFELNSKMTFDEIAELLTW